MQLADILFAIVCCCFVLLLMMLTLMLGVMTYDHVMLILAKHA